MNGEAQPASSAAPAGARAGRGWRWVRRLAFVLSTLVALAVVALAVVLGSLDRPWVKTRIQAAVQAAAALDVDYRAIRIRPFSGLRIDGIVIRTPPALRALAPDLARVERLEARWSLSSLLGRGPKIERVVVDGVRVAVAQDAGGRSSLDLPGASGPTKPAPAAKTTAASSPPLSRLLARALESAPPVGQIEISRVEGVWVSARGGAIQRDAVSGVALRVAVQPAKRGWQVQVDLGSKAAPLELEVRRDGPARGHARLALWLGAHADSTDLSLGADLRVRDQDLVSVAATEILHLEASVHPDPDRGETEVRLERLVAADGAVDLAAEANLPDAPSAALRVRRAEGKADLARLLGALPAGLVPLAVDRGVLRFRIAGLQAGAGAPRLGTGGEAHVEADFSDVRVPLPRGTSRLAALELRVDAQPAPSGGFTGRAAVNLHGLELRQPDQAIRADGVTVGAEVQAVNDGRWSGVLRLGLASLDLSGPTRIALRKLELDARARELHVDSNTPLASRGDVEVDTRIGNGEVRVPGARIVAQTMALEVHAPLSGRAPVATGAELSLRRLRFLGRAGRSLVDAPARLEVKVSDAYPDQLRPAMSRGKLHASVDLATLHASLDADKRRDSADFDVALNIAGLTPLRPLLPATLVQRLDLGKTAVALETRGRAERLASATPSLREETKLRLDRLAFDRTAARTMTLQIRSNGDVWRHHLDLDLGLAGVSADGRALGDEDLTLALAFNRGQPSLNLDLRATGAAGVKLAASAAVQDPEHRTAYDVHAQVDHLDGLRRLSALVPALGELDLSRTELKLDSHGALTGIVAGVDRSGQLRVAPRPLETIAGDGDLAIRIDGARLRSAGRRIALGSAEVKASFKGRGVRRDLAAQVGLNGLQASSNDLKIDLGQLDEALAVSLTGDPKSGTADLTNRLVVRRLEQDVAPFVPTEEVTLAVAASRDRQGVVHLSKLSLDDPEAGTRLSLTGGAEMGRDRPRISLRARLDQDLGQLRHLPGGLEARGRVGLDLKADSPDLELFHARAGLDLDDVQVRMQPAGIAVESVDARIPVSLDLVLGPGGPTLPHEEAVNPYASLRFADQQPLMNRSNFLSIGRLVTPFVTIAPLAGNLEIDQNIISLGQLEMGVRGGRITGECALDWNGWKSKVQAHVRASGVQSSHGEPFDGDAALVISAGDRSIDGRAQILRIGRRHLLDLLDLADPHRVDPAMNRVRHALAFGYPDQVRIAFNHGFASARVTLGGLARLIRIDEIRGIPTGSLLDKVLASSPTPESAP